ncbi:hypothetical protein M3A88_11110 [Kocuria marina]|uniref:hypothetical protein n=1 Tax=Kocuria marina TaxID=223184 RepID=UPI002989A998|nr:hypothetical protein [Kocuria marina]MCT1735778.1 hypothetical protein [Kocuria marina]
MSRRNRAQWGVSSLPGILQAHARQYRAAAAYLRAGAGNLGGDERYRGSVAVFDRQADLCVDLTLPLYWVTTPMAQVALDASLNIPVLTPAMAPTKRGFLAVEGDLPPLPQPEDEGWWSVEGPRTTEGIPPRALLWNITARELELTVFTHESQMPGGIRVSKSPLQELFAVHIPREDDGTWPLITPSDPKHAPDPQQMEERAHVPVSGAHLALFAWTCATWHLMMMPTLAQRRSLDLRTGGEPAAGTRPEREVTHIDLRPLKQVTTEPTDADTPARTHSHRWVVRGHWVQQPHGPGHFQRRLQWRESYIKGPAGAPLLRSRPVNVWRR